MYIQNQKKNVTKFNKMHIRIVCVRKRIKYKLFEETLTHKCGMCKLCRRYLMELCDFLKIIFPNFDAKQKENIFNVTNSICSSDENDLQFW